MRIRLTRRRLLLVVAATGLAASAAAFLLGRGWTLEDFDAIRPGIRRAEVEAVLGPPEYERTTLGRIEDGSFVTNDDPEVQRRLYHRNFQFTAWSRVGLRESDGCVVIFDGDEVACRYRSKSPYDSHIQRIRWWLHRLYRSVF